ncbi:tail fiber domain-containing protein [Marinicella litoralis]|uniref:Peptidase S74 domain-containing protein n=1 Tax=Marinicella litoralis TaxID=644220 RepID=A0A4R6Y3U8_9GAMM|nr:tail fiber domain-containing protein [Marinicella litoralis]TDR23778.1 hypothetical protein C8D91_0644 [Marinicella litoralis]
MKYIFKKTALAASLALCGLANAQTETFLFDNQLEFTGLNDQTGYELRLRLPQGELKTLYINPSKSMTFEATDFAINQFQDGIYKYELLPLNTSVKKSRTNQSTNNSDNDLGFEVLSGTFTVLKGGTLIDQDEAGRDQQILDDLIVDGSACIGQDCVNGESFGFDTLRLKENNLRIRFMDTSNSASFPSNDWELTANDSTNGGANKFSITDIDGGRAPFTVEAGARNHALYVESDGDVGIGTNSPVVDLHITTGDSPTVRLEQNGTSGWTPQTWDVAGNETNFFIRDATNGSKLPFRIKPNAPTSSLFIAANGYLGFGTASPTHGLHLLASENVTLKLENSVTDESWKIANKGASLQYGKSGSLTGRFEFFDTGQFQIGNPSARIFDLDDSGNLTITGLLSEGSDVNSKENIFAVNPTEILQKVVDLPISVWNYKFDSDNVKHLGPMAQDFYKLFGLGSREDKIASLDSTGVALASIKALATKVDEKESQINQLKNENEALQNRLQMLEAAFEKFNK